MGMILKNTTEYTAGQVFYYTACKKTYGAIFLFRQREYSLFAISEEIPLSVQSITLADILSAPLYTIAWFSDIELLPDRRLHHIGTVAVNGNFSNCAGLLEDDSGSLLLKNVGQSSTWKHSFRAFALRETSMQDVPKYIPKTWR
ncbi:MAG: hypothetical protein IJ766_06840 [Clostridia bacterium]|nr:hypothetical protein [Clostridia bacterium]